MQVRYLQISAANVFNLTSPRYLPELSRNWRGRAPWWDKKYEPVRDLCETNYITYFNQETGHYRRLEESVRTQGFRNPVMLSTGRLIKRRLRELPPNIRRTHDFVVCEYVGGSRLYIAAKLGMTVPAIVCDYGNVFPKAEEIPYRNDEAVLMKFLDRPRRLRWQPDGSVYVNLLPYMHFPEHMRAGAAHEQIKTRRNVVLQVLRDVAKWMKENDRPS